MIDMARGASSRLTLFPDLMGQSAKATLHLSVRTNVVQRRIKFCVSPIGDTKVTHSP